MCKCVCVHEILYSDFCVRCGSLTHSGLLESSGESQWELLSLVDNKQHGSQQRMIEEVKYFPQYSQQSTAGIEMTRMERLQLQEERDREREEMLKIKEERERETQDNEAGSADGERKRKH